MPSLSKTPRLFRNPGRLEKRWQATALQTISLLGRVACLARIANLRPGRRGWLASIALEPAFTRSRIAEMARTPHRTGVCLEVARKKCGSTGTRQEFSRDGQPPMNRMRRRLCLAAKFLLGTIAVLVTAFLIIFPGRETPSGGLRQGPSGGQTYALCFVSQRGEEVPSAKFG